MTIDKEQDKEPGKKKNLPSGRRQDLKDRLVAVFRAGLESPDPVTRKRHGEILEGFLSGISEFIEVDPAGKWRLKKRARARLKKISADRQAAARVKKTPNKATGEA